MPHTVEAIKIAPFADIFVQLHLIKRDALQQKFPFFKTDYGRPLYKVQVKRKFFSHFNCFPSVLIFDKTLTKTLNI
jgi:hypothetical protein